MPRKKTPLKPSYRQGHFDNLMLLSSDKNFQDKIREIRTFLQIPDEGFDINSPDMDVDINKWNKESDRRGAKLLSKVRHVADGLNSGGLNDVAAQALTNYLHEEVPINYLTGQVNSIIRDFGLPAQYANGIRQYILYNEITTAPAQSFVVHSPNNKQGELEQAVHVTFYSKINDDDLKRLKKWINEVVGKHLVDPKPLKNIDAKILMTKMYENRKRYDPQQEGWYKMKTKEIIDNVRQDTGIKISASQVRDAPRELASLRKKRFKKK